MIRLHEKLIVNVVASTPLESALAQLARNHRVAGYTVLDARGYGNTGPQSGALLSDSNIYFMLLVSNEQAEDVLADIQKMIESGHQLIAFVTRTEVLRDGKFSRRADR
jgi:hypothetical protein